MLSNLFKLFDNLEQRERVSIFFLLVTAIVIVFFEFFADPLMGKLNGIETKIISSTNEVRKLKSQIIILKAQQKNKADPKKKQRNKLKLINEEIKNINARLKENIRGLIEPKEMSKVLEFVLSRQSGLKLQSIKSLASKPLSPIIKGEGAKEDLGIYHHGMTMTLTGSYLATLKYLKTLSDLPWDFYWDSLDMNMNKYPNTSITINVHTLSFNKDWIGV